MMSLLPASQQKGRPVEREYRCEGQRHKGCSMIRSLITAIGLAVLSSGCASMTSKHPAELAPMLHSVSNQFQAVFASPERFRAQILISEVRTNGWGAKVLKRHGYRVDAEYFYPASSIKLCAAVAALQTLEQLELEHPGATNLLETPIRIAPLFPGDVAQTKDIGNLQGGPITLGQEIRKLALVSDNQAFNRLYDLIGHSALNENMHALGLRSVVINHRLSDARSIPDNRASAPVTFHASKGDPILVPARSSRLILTNKGPGLLVGDGYQQGGKLIKTPMDFSTRNGMSVMDLQNLLVKLARPDMPLGTPKLRLSGTHRAHLLQAMSEYPRESTNPVYREPLYPDDYSKFLLPGIRRIFPNRTPGERIEITAKIGRAYGFTVDNSYLKNPRNGRAVFVTAILYTNADGILNDDKYEYETVADPFFAALGELVALRWLSD